MARILLTGASGQVGYELERSLQGLGEVVALDRSRMNLADLDQLRDVVRTVKPALIVNPAAYTAVDKAEAEPDLAMLVNCHAPAVLAEEARKLNAALIHYSTDYVFDGSKSTPYTEVDAPCPINVYGQSKLAGEQAIQAAGVRHLIFRTSWVYGTRGQNFLLTMLRLAQERDQLSVVADQHGAPTWCRTIADTSAHIVAACNAAPDSDTWWQENGGLYHLTAQGQTTWHGFAEAIFANAALAAKPTVSPIATSDFPRPAPRPANSVMSSQRLMEKFCALPAWDAALKLCQS